MKNMIAAFGLLVSVMAFAISDSEKEALLNRNMGPVADRVQMGSLIMGGSGSVYVRKSGDTMSGPLRVVSGVTVTGPIRTTSTSASSIATSGSISVANTVSVGSSGAGGTVRLKNDAGTDNWVAGTPGSAGSKGFHVYDLIGNSARILISTTNAPIELQGSVSFPSGQRAVSLTLSGASTFISNATVTSSTKVMLTGVGAANVAPWLIGVSAASGYSVGATGGGSAHALLVEGQ